MNGMIIALRRAWRLWQQARINAKAVKEWWDRCVDEADRAENPMKL